MIKIDIKADTEKLRKQLQTFTETQLQSAIAKTVTNTAHAAKDDLVKGMRRVFDRPTPWTLNAFYVEPARPNKLYARVHIKEGDLEGLNPARYLTPEAFGGPRRMKRSEKALGSRFYVPSRGAIMDQWGNMQRGQIVQMLSRLGAFGEQGYAANMTDKSRARLMRVNRKTGKAAMTPARGRRADYFIAKSKSTGEPLGVYRLVGPGRVQPVVIFQKKAPAYQERFPFERIVMESVAKNYERKLKAAIGKVAAGFQWT